MMKLITYTIKAPGKNYQDLYEAIKSLGDSRHCLTSTWLVKTRLTTSEIDETLRPHIDINDSLFVIEVNPSTACGQLSQDVLTWIPERQGLLDGTKWKSYLPPQ